MHCVHLTRYASTSRIVWIEIIFPRRRERHIKLITDAQFEDACLEEQQVHFFH
jgi:hypothetical protein